MNPCCEHLFREAKREIEIRDKRIIELQNECTRLFEPTRAFWNEENHKRIENLIKENEVLFEKTVELEAENAKLRECVEWYADRKNCDNADFSHVEIDDSGEEIADGGYRARQVLKELGEK